MKRQTNAKSKTKFLKVTSAQQLAAELRKNRKKQKITVEKLAQFADLSRYAVMNFENNKTDIRLSTLLKILKLCNIELHIRIAHE